MELTIGELAATAATAVAAADVRGANRRVTDLPDERTIRWYSTIGLLERPSGNRGRTALYGERHVLQLVAIKRRQAEGRTLAEIQAELLGATDRTLRRIADMPPPVDVAPVPRAASASTARQFWRERPAASEPQVLVGLDLGDGVVLMLPGQPKKAEVDSIRAAAQPLLDLLAERRLTRGSAS
ncbi:MAG: MerR family transcriptional regulator [Pseudonocardiales bacterium]|nr:MAG: MerR family transcriptional regulator [Pseudonocardiales bacterium]